MPANPEIFARLQREIHLLQGHRPLKEEGEVSDLGPMAAAFPDGRFPRSGIHEFLSASPETSAASAGFLCGLLSPLMKTGGSMIWVGPRRRIFPPALTAFGIPAEQVLFLELPNEREVLWAVEEALKCRSLAAVVGDVKELSFTASRRWQLAIEGSGVPAFVIRHSPRRIESAVHTRWQVRSFPSEPGEGLPGLGRPRWQAELVKVRHGHPGSWVVEWGRDGFRYPPTLTLVREMGRRKTG